MIGSPTVPGAPFAGVRHAGPTWGVNNQTLGSTALATIVDALRSAGVGGVELTADCLEPHLERPAGARELLDGAGISLLGVSPLPEQFAWHEEWTRELESSLRRRLAIYRELGASYFVLPFMTEGGDVRTTRIGLDRARSLASEAGIGLALESIGHRSKFRRLEEVITLVDTSEDTVGVLLDSFHFFRAGHRIEDLALLADRRVWAVQVSNSDGRPLEELLGYRHRRFPLDGPWPTGAFVDAASRWAPAAPVIVEVIGDVVPTRDPFANARLAAEQLDRLRNYGEKVS